MTRDPAPTPFSTILIANRGEIALRVMRTARSLGHRTVAVYSTADAHAAHVAAADRGVCIGDALPSQSYLRIGAIVDAARLAGADAVHPGYGFLAENAEFASACRDAGLVFIGPSAEAIRTMGDKAAAKRRMAAAGVPCIAGYDGEDQSEARLAGEAARIGYPLMIKASAGGGGRGMRRVERAEDFAASLRSARSEAANAFGDATVILERAIVGARHVEVQVFADRHGNVVHLGERDCSVQRRHQKLIEEAPSPAVDGALRERMGATAVAATRAIGYEGAGTIEFLLDPDGGHHFMEMNTRLQVEHPVTEAVTGLDLVEWQLRVAAGEPLPLAQSAIRLAGHAIEVRLCAEDAATGFVPCSGTMRLWRAPAGVRVDHAMASGTVVSPFYDSMIAKLVAHGPTREDARRRLSRALADTVALGVRTNQAFLGRCLDHPVFVAGAATTDFVDRHGTGLVGADAAATTRAAVVGAWLLRETHPAVRQAEGRRLVFPLPVGTAFRLDGTGHRVQVAHSGPQTFDLTIDGHRHRLTSVAIGAHDARFDLDGLTEHATFSRDGDVLWLHFRGAVHRLDDLTYAPAARAHAGSDGRVRAVTSGRVVAIDVAAGDAVCRGQSLVTLEAMKMQHVCCAPVAGIVRAVSVTDDEQVQAGRVIVEIDATPDEVSP